EEEGPPLMEASVGVPRAQPGKWASCIRVIEPASRQTLSLLELSENEAALSSEPNPTSPPLTPPHL
ncbi:MAG: hypothetical protein SGPRY_005133, partial [Prymnesium sp.]